MTSRIYWANRAAFDTVSHMGTAEQTAATLERAAKKAGKYLNEETRRIFAAFQDFGISEREARTLLRSCEHGSVLSRLRRAGSSIKDPKKRKAFLDALNSAGAYHWRIQRIEELNRDIDRYVRAYRRLQQSTITETLGNIAHSSYYHTIYRIQQETGLGFSFSTFSRDKVNAILRSNWSGLNYSDRIWNNTAGLAARLKEELLVSAMSGRSVEKTARIIAAAFGGSADNARRLVRTESAYVEGEATDAGYEEAGIDDYIFVATLDIKTSKKCAALDGRTFHRKNRKVGTNYPPLHPWCRSTTIASFGPDTLKNLERRARDKDGNPIKVPADMTYKEWAKKYCPEALEKFEKKPKGVDKSGKSGIINYAKAIDVFDGSTIRENAHINFDNVVKMLENSEVGKIALAQLKERGVKPEIIYTAPRYGERGSQQGNHIKLYIQKIPNETVMAQTLIHETTHLYYGIGQSQWAEAVCFAKEKVFLTGKPLTVAERRYIVKLAKDNYPEFEWKRSGI